MDFQEMKEQKEWVETMVPRQALLRFKVPYEGHQTVEYLAGEMYLQPFSKRSSTEVRLHVSPPDPSTGVYATKSYDCKSMEECMFFHNCVTRRAHIPSPGAERTEKRAVSYDHSLAHGILHAWVDRAMKDPGISYNLQGQALQDHVHSMIRGLDMLYGKILGLRWSDQFSDIIKNAQ